MKIFLQDVLKPLSWKKFSGGGGGGRLPYEQKQLRSRLTKKNTDSWTSGIVKNAAYSCVVSPGSLHSLLKKYKSTTGDLNLPLKPAPPPQIEAIIELAKSAVSNFFQLGQLGHWLQAGRLGLN
jgi:hypothetical protein